MPHPDCSRQRIESTSGKNRFIAPENGIVFSLVEHDGDIQQSDEEGSSPTRRPAENRRRRD